MKFTKYVLGLAAAASIAIACSPTEEIDKLKDSIGIRINTELMTKSAYVKVFDIQNGLVPSNVKIQVTSSNEQDVFQVSGSRDLTLVEGRIGIGLHPRAFNGSESASVDLLITADNYLDVTKTITFDTDENGQDVLNVDIPMVNLSNPPEGIEVSEVSASLSDGSLNEELSLVVGSDSAKPELDITLPQGLKFKNKSGQFVSGSSLNLNVASFSADDVNAVNAFPGGFASDNINVNGEIVSGGFVTAGFASFEMKIGNEEIKSFDQAIEVRSKISSEVINPNTGELIKSGDTLEIYSFDEDNNQWTFEGDGNVVAGDSGLEISYKQDHFSFWSYGFKVPLCESNVLFNWDLPSSRPQTYKVEFRATGTKQSLWSGTLYNVQDNSTWYVWSNWFRYYASGVNADFIIKDPVTEDVLAFYAGFVYCQEGLEKVVTVPETAVSSGDEVTFKAVGYCEGKANYEFRPSFTVEYKDRQKGDSVYKTLGYVKNGEFSTPYLEVGNSYDFRVIYDGDIYEKTNILVESGSYDFAFDVPADICATLP